MMDRGRAVDDREAAQGGGRRHAALPNPVDSFVYRPGSAPCLAPF